MRVLNTALLLVVSISLHSVGGEKVTTVQPCVLPSSSGVKLPPAVEETKNYIIPPAQVGSSSLDNDDDFLVQVQPKIVSSSSPSLSKRPHPETFIWKKVSANDRCNYFLLPMSVGVLPNVFGALATCCIAGTAAAFYGPLAIDKVAFLSLVAGFGGGAVLGGLICLTGGVVMFVVDGKYKMYKMSKEQAERVRLAGEQTASQLIRQCENIGTEEESGLIADFQERAYQSMKD